MKEQRGNGWTQWALFTKMHFYDPTCKNVVKMEGIWHKILISVEIVIVLKESKWLKIVCTLQ